MEGSGNSKARCRFIDRKKMFSQNSNSKRDFHIIQGEYVTDLGEWQRVRFPD